MIGPASPVVKRSAPPATTPAAIVVSALLVCVLVLAGASGPIRAAIVLAFLCLVPGLALVRLVDLGSWALQAALAVALSLALSGFAAGLLVYSHVWSPQGVVLIVAGVAVAATVHEEGGLLAAGARSAARGGEDRLAALAAGGRRIGNDLRVRLWIGRVEATRLLEAAGHRVATRRPQVIRPAIPQLRRPALPAPTWPRVRSPRVLAARRPRQPQSRGASDSIESLMFDELVLDELQYRRVRRLLALTTTKEIGSQIWLIEDLDLRKRRQEGAPPPAGVWVTAVSDTLSVPLDWRVLFDVAAPARHAWRSRLALEALDWLCGLDYKPPVIVAGPGYGSLRGFRDGLEARQLDYLVRVEPHTAFDEIAPSGTDRRGRWATDSRSKIADCLRAREVELEPFSWTENGRGQSGSAASRVVRSRFGALRVDALDSRPRGNPSTPRRLVCEWPDGEDLPVRFWLSNLPDETPIAGFASLAKLPARADLVGSRPPEILAGQPDWPTSSGSLDMQLTLWVMAQEVRALKRNRSLLET